MPIDLYPHQLDALKEIQNGSIIGGGVGTGKTRVALAYYYLKECGGRLQINGSGRDERMREPKDVYVITTAKKRDSLDWVQEAANFRVSTTREGSLDGVKLTVLSWNAIVDMTEVKDAFFVFDEQRVVGGGAWAKAFIKIAKNNRWVLLSATPGDNWSDLCPVFVANGFYKNRTEFYKTHAVYSRFSAFPKIEKYVETDRLEAYKRQILVEMEYQRHTHRNSESVFVNYDEEQMKRVWVDRWDIYNDEPLQDAGAMFRTARKLVNSDPSRLYAVMRLMEKHPKLIVFYNHNHELEMLRTLGGTLDIPVGEWNGQKHQEIPDADRWLYIVQYTAGAEGWNCIETDAIAFYSLSYSYKVWEQAHGRIDRLNTPFTELYYYAIRSNAKIENLIWKALQQKRNFNEKKESRTRDYGFEHTPVPTSAQVR